MAARPAPYLRGGGQAIVTPREDMTIAEMESVLAARPMRRNPEQVHNMSAPQTARALLEENKQLIHDKQERKALARKNSREFFDRLLAHNRLVTEGDKAKSMSRRDAQRELAQYYKAKMAEKERVKANEYQAKVESGIDVQYFPFVEGETINKSREVQNQQMRDEMRSFLQSQREQHPPRMDTLRAETSVDHSIKYPMMPFHRSVGSSQPPDRIAHGGDDAGFSGDVVAPHMSRHPRFLSRAREHMSRRLHDSHVRQALEQKVQDTKAELEAMAQQKQAEIQQWEEGMRVYDALRYDNGQARVMENRRVQDFIKSQIEERKGKVKQEHQEIFGNAGYFGPEEKEVQDPDLHRDHCTDLIKQMQVDQLRRESDRSQRLRQEKRLIDNGIAEMSQDRMKERQKALQHREVLTTTWKSQQKIKKTINSIDAL